MDKLIKRINELAKKQKSTGLTDKEAEEQKKLRDEYLMRFRKNFKQQLDKTNVKTPDGKITPLKDFKKK